MATPPQALSGATPEALPTPSLLIDRACLARNIDRLRSRLATLGVPLRPHVKTAKCAEITRLMLAGQPGGVTVSTLAEARDCVDHGITDILYAVGIVPAKLDAVAALVADGAHVTVLLDAPATARDIAARAAALGLELPVMIEIDSDGHRAGLRPDDPALVETGRILDAGPGTRLAGVLTHAGDSYRCRSAAALEAMAERERGSVVDAAARLREAGLPCPHVSVGSTPTALYAARLDGVTEVRAGVYVFMDLVMAGIGVCSVDDIALSVLTSVIGHQHERGRMFVDAGWMALSRDRGTADQPIDQGYGLVRAPDGGPTPAALVVSATSQEHGIVTARGGAAADLSHWPVGSRLRVLPNHACATAAQHAGYAVLDERGRIEAYWSRHGGW